MALADQAPLVMDVLPWPYGHGFTGADTWWEYVLSQEEKLRLDHLMGVALLDEDVCDRLVNKRDHSLLTAFGLSEETRNWLGTVKANSLIELAQAIVANTSVPALIGA
ncbi:MAG TPA: hypothetical protein VHP83_05470 [Aggregatilineaceae bacterium]|nr:hypothetical protein [Aggregatilineaceae bacterium]